MFPNLYAERKKVPSEAWEIIWRLPDDISLPDWVEANVKLSDKMAAEPGPLRISRTPYIRGPLEALGNIFIEEIVLVWGRQLGKSTGVQYAFACYVVAQDPGPATFLLPTRDKAKEISETKLDPIFRACPEVARRMPDNPDDYTKLRMNFQTMIFAMAWAGSDTQTTTRSNRYLFVDEADEIKKTVGENAIDPIKGIEQTTTTFSNRKIVKTSTPTTPEGNIWQALKQCQRIFEYWVACPHCGVYQILYWENVRFGEDHDPVVVEENAYYDCEACQKEISNLDKIRILAGGQWRARLTEGPCDQIMKNIRAKIEETIDLETLLTDPKYRRIKKIGFHLPKWYSPFSGGTFGVIAKEFLEANKDLQEGDDFAPMRNWRIYNAARPWMEESLSKTELELMENLIDLEPNVCPANTVAVTCGIDPSEGGFFVDVLAWHMVNQTISAHLIDYRKIFDWDELANFIKNTAYPVVGGANKKPILVSGLDTGGSEYEGEDTTMTEAAYQWLLKMRKMGLNVFGTKGMSHPSKNRAKQTKIEKMPGRSGKPIPGGLVLWEINTGEMKRVLWFHLKIEKDNPGRFTFHSQTDADYIKQILAEKEVRDKTGNWEWVRRGRNHHLDGTVIAMTLAERDCYGLQIFSGVGSKAVARRTISKGVE